MTRDWQNLIRPEHFAMVIHPDDRGAAATRANEIIREALKEAPEVKGSVEFDAWSEEGTEPHFKSTHSARLVDIKELE